MVEEPFKLAAAERVDVTKHYENSPPLSLGNLSPGNSTRINANANAVNAGNQVMQQRGNNTMYFSPREAQMISTRSVSGSGENKGFMHNLLAALGCTTRDPYSNEQGMQGQKALAFDSPVNQSSARRGSDASGQHSASGTIFSDAMKSGQFPHGLSAGEQVLIENGLAFLDRPDDRMNALNGISEQDVEDVLKTDRTHLNNGGVPANNSGKTSYMKAPDTARGTDPGSFAFTDGDLYTNYPGADPTPRPDGQPGQPPQFSGFTSARGFNQACSQYQKAKQIAAERLQIGGKGQNAMGITIPSTHSGLVNDDDRWWLEPDAERRIPSKHPDSPVSPDFRQHNIAEPHSIGTHNGYDSNASFNSYTAMAQAAGGQQVQPLSQQPPLTMPVLTRNEGNGSSADPQRNQVINPNDHTPHFALSASAAHLHGGALVTAENPLGIPGGSPAEAGEVSVSLQEGESIVRPNAQPAGASVTLQAAAGANPAAGSPEDQLQDGGGLRRDTTLEIEAGYYADMLAALGEESNQKQQLEGQVGELSMQLTKERREASHQEQALRLRVQELEVMQAHFQEYMNAMDGTLPGSSPDLLQSGGQTSEPMTMGLGTMPGTAPALAVTHSHAESMVSAHSMSVTQLPPAALIKSKESAASANYESA